MTAGNPSHIGESRKLTIFERFLLSSANTGNNLIVVHAFAYDSGLPSEAELRERAAGLQALFPLLHARVEGARTRDAALVVQEPWAPENIVCTGTAPADATLESVLADALGRWRRRDVAEPLWGVELLTRPSGDGGFVVVSCNHVVMDGRGSLACALALTDPNGLAGFQPEAVVTKTYDDTVLLRPTLGLMIPTLWRELCVPLLPRFLQARATAGDPWPGQCPTPEGRDLDVGVARIDAPTAARLKDMAKTKGVATLHPALQAAYDAAVWAVFHNVDIATGETRPGASSKDTPIHLVSDSPRAERDTKQGHSAMTGVYTSLIEHAHDVRGTDDMWGTARTLSAFLKDKKTDTAARQVFGLLTWLPDGTHPDGSTGWMRYLNERAASPAPFFESLQVSNLGRVDLPPHATDYAWSQIAHPSNMALAGSVAGHRAGCVLTTQWWQGLPPRHKVDELHRMWEGILTLMAEGREGSIVEFADEVRQRAK